MTISGAINRASGALKPMGKRLMSKPIYSSSAIRGAMIGAGIGAGVGGIKSGIQGDSIIGGAVSGAIGGGVLGAGISVGRSMYTTNKRLNNIKGIRASRGNMSTAINFPKDTQRATMVMRGNAGRRHMAYMGSMRKRQISFGKTPMMRTGSPFRESTGGQISFL